MNQASRPDPTSAVRTSAGAAATPTTVTGIARSARPLPVLTRDRACAAAGDRGKRRTDICDCGLTEDPPYCDGACGN
jgi:CDGSH-type Zn-finger protein